MSLFGKLKVYFPIIIIWEIAKSADLWSMRDEFLILSCYKTDNWFGSYRNNFDVYPWTPKFGLFKF